jgi:hypothetical protein
MSLYVGNMTRILVVAVLTSYLISCFYSDAGRQSATNAAIMPVPARLAEFKRLMKKIETQAKALRANGNWMSATSDLSFVVLTDGRATRLFTLNPWIICEEGALSDLFLSEAGYSFLILYESKDELLRLREAEGAAPSAAYWTAIYCNSHFGVIGVRFLESSAWTKKRPMTSGGTSP